MTGKERALAALRGQPQDRPPVIPIVGQAGAAFCEVSYFDHAHDPALLARCQIDCARRFGYDGIYISADTWVNAEAIGFPHVQHPPDQPAGGKGAWIRSVEDIERLSLPDPQRSGRWPLMLDAVRHAVDQVGDELLIIANFDQSPFSLACQLRDINRFTIDILENTTFAHRLLDYCAEAVSNYAIALAHAGAHVLNTGDSSAGGTLIGSRYYETFAFPYEKRVFETIRRVTDVPVTLHICGDTRACLEKMVETTADGIELDEHVDLSVARKTCAARATVIGNVDPIHPLLRGTPEEVRTACRNCLDAFRGSNRFILSSGCALSPSTPPENIKAMVEAVETFTR